MNARLISICAALAASSLLCQNRELHSVKALLSSLEKACAARDAGGVMTMVDVHYQDDLGGPGRLEDDLRRLFSVYGRLGFHLQDDVSFAQQQIEGQVVIEGKRLRFEGPLQFKLEHWPSGWLIRSGLLTDLRGIVFALRERRLALENGSTERLSLVVSPEYRGEVGNKERLIEQVRADLSIVKTQAFLSNGVDISVDRGRAWVIQSFLLVTHIGERKIERRGRERLQLRKEGSLWRFIGGMG